LSTVCVCSAGTAEGDGKVASVRFAQTTSNFAGFSVRVVGTRMPAATNTQCASTINECLNFDANGNLVDQTGAPANLQGLCPSDATPPGDWHFTYTLFSMPGCTMPAGTFTCLSTKDLLSQLNPNGSVETLMPGPNLNQIVCAEAPPVPPGTPAFCQARRELIINGTVTGTLGNSGDGTPTPPAPITRFFSPAVVNGEILSVPNVDLTAVSQSSASVNGNILSNGTIMTSPGPAPPNPPFVAMGGQNIMLAPPPPLNVTFPGTMVTPTIVGGTLQPNAPGQSYNTLTLSNSTVNFVMGDYFFNTLTLNSGGIINVTQPGVRIFVQMINLNNGGAFAGQPVFLGYLGTTLLNVNVDFRGTLVAPDAPVALNSGPDMQNPVILQGSFFGLDLTVNNGSNIICTSLM